MQLQPYIGEKILTASDVDVRIDPEDQKRAQVLVLRTTAIATVNDEVEFSAARTAAGELKAMLDEIAASKKAVKLPFDHVTTRIDNLAKGVAGPVEKEHKRILGLLNIHVEKLKKAREAEEKRQTEARRLVQAEADRKVREAQEAAYRAQEELRAAKDEIEAARLREASQARENRLLQEQLAAELAMDIEELGQPSEPLPGLVPGGRVDTKYDFELVNVQLTCEARCYRLLRWELDIPACRDAVKNLVEMNPNAEPTLPGIRITKRISVSVKAAS